MKANTLGRWAFILGIVVAALLGFMTFAYSTLILVILGLIVGFINIAEKETTSYLVAVIALLVIGLGGLQVFSMLGSVNVWIQTVLASFVVFVAASGLVVAVKAILQMSQSE
jgi:hypothetical protein